jgi:crossover junction endodeoxyribonuclease RuvC
MSIVAIDPGLSGAIAWLDGETVGAVPMPMAGKEIDLPAIRDLLLRANPRVIVIERVASRPGQGVASTFKFGAGWGSLIGLAAGLQIPTELVTPQAWKREVLAGTAKDKAAAIDYCRRRHPDLPLVLPRCRNPHDGIADALCLLEYARRKL